MSPNDVITEATNLKESIVNQTATHTEIRLQISLLREKTRAMIIRLAEAKYTGTPIY